MNIMKLLLEEFAPVKPVVTESTASSVTPVLQYNQPMCSRCCGLDHWQPYGSDQWYCINCDPPPTQSMVAHRTGAPTITAVVAFVVDHPCIQSISVGGNRIEFPSYETRAVCRCGSHMVTETTWSDGLKTFQCSSCAASIAAEAVR